MLRAFSQAVGAFFAASGISLFFYFLPNFPAKALLLVILVGPVVEEMCKYYFLRNVEQSHLSWISLVQFGFVFFFLEFLLKFFVYFRNLSPSLYEFLMISLPIFALIMILHISCALFYLENRKDIAFFKALAFHASANLLAVECRDAPILGDFRFLIPFLIVVVWSLFLFWPLRNRAYAPA
jgi:hypothetical protein